MFKYVDKDNKPIYPASTNEYHRTWSEFVTVNGGVEVVEPRVENGYDKAHIPYLRHKTYHYRARPASRCDWWHDVDKEITIVDLETESANAATQRD
jgi:hypothetical protein